MIKYIILNGPSGCGKTTVARELVSRLTKLDYVAIQDSFDAPLKHFFAAALGEKYRGMDKSRMRPELNGYTLNESLLTLKSVIRNRYGEDVLAKWLIHRTLKKPYSKPRYVIIDDGNFREDVDTMPNKLVVCVIRRTDGNAMQFNPGEEGVYFDDHEYILYNDSLLNNLWMAVKSLAKYVVKNEFTDA